MRTRDGKAASLINPGAAHGCLRHIRRHVLLLLGYYNVSMHRGILNYAREADWAVDDTYERVGFAPLWWRGDGILGLITSPKDVRAWEHFRDLPLVDLSKGWISDSMPPPDRQHGIGRPRVFYDNERVARLAAEHFLERRFRHVAFLNVGNYWLEQERIPAMREAVARGGGTFFEIDYYRHFSKESAADPMASHYAAQQWLTGVLRELPKPLGLVLPADDLAPRVLQACEDAGVAVPEEVGVLGCDNDPMICDYTPVPLSSVDLDWERIGYEGARMLDHIMDGGAAPVEPVLIPPKGVVARMSTNILAVPDPLIARGLRFIWERFPESIGTPEVAHAAGINRRTLERGFRLHLGCGVSEEILRVRVNHAKHLLTTTSHKAHEIAAMTGFSGMVPFSKAFLRVTGVRPSQYRTMSGG